MIIKKYTTLLNYLIKKKNRVNKIFKNKFKIDKSGVLRVLKEIKIS